MQCAQCGAISDEGQRFCYNCGARIQVSYDPPAAPTQTMQTPSAVQPAPYQPASIQPAPAGYGVQVVPNSNMAIISLVSGILAWVILPFLAAIVAIVTGHMARKEIRQSSGRVTGEGMAVIGMILGYAQMAVFVLGACALFFVFIIAVA